MNSGLITGHALKPVWLKAAVLGGLWASVEIIIGSFFHNMRIPFSGTLLAANATVLMVSFYQMWPVKGLIWRAGCIAALMKSISPSSVILGPMIGILTEALIIEVFIRVFGNNLISLSVAGALSVSSALIHKVVSLIILYGFNIVRLYVDVFNFLAKQMRIENPDPWLLVFIVATVYGILGIMSAVLGFYTGARSHKMKAIASEPSISFTKADNPFAIDQEQKFSLVRFFIHLMVIPAGLILFNYLPLIYCFVFVAIYSALSWYMYKQSLRRLRKLVFWGQLFILTLLAALFWNGIKSEDTGPFNGLLIGLEMNLRAVFVVIAFSSFGVELRNPKIREFLFRRGFDKIYASLGLAFSALPSMIEAMPKPKKFLRHPVQSFGSMMVQAQNWLETLESTRDQQQLPKG